MPRQVVFTSALVSALCIFLVTLLGAIATPGYSHLSQFISELGASQSRYEFLVRFVGFLPAGISLVVFSYLAYKSLPKSSLTTSSLLALAIYALGYVAAALFPCDPGCRPELPSVSQSIHNLTGGLGYLLAPGFLFALAHCSRSWPASAPLPAMGFAASALSLLGLLSLSPSSPYVGLSQRAIEASVLGWALMCGWYIRAHSRVAA